MSVLLIGVQKYQVKSLFKLCIDCIKWSIEKSGFAASSNSGIINIEMGIKNQIQQLRETILHFSTTCVLEEIVKSFTGCSVKAMESEILEHLIIPQIQKMWFVFYNEDYLRFFPYFEKLSVINLKNTEADNFCLRTIGAYCLSLRSLNLNECRDVSDTGIEWLLTRETNLGKRDRNKPINRISQTLKKLNILHTSVSSHGILIALRYALSLAIIENHHTFEALVKFADVTITNQLHGAGNFSLSVLNIPHSKIYRSDSLGIVIPLCRSISHVIIHAIKGFKDSDLLCLKSIKQLTALQILRCPKIKLKDETEITFDGGVAPLLQVIGKSLEILDILHLDSFRVSTIIEYCPHLVSLSIGEKFGGNTRSSVMESESLSLFFLRIDGNEKQHLIMKDLKTFCCNYNMPSVMLRFLLSSPLLAHIKITNCNTFTDSILKSAVKHNRFRKLELLELSHCNSVSPRGILTLLMDVSPRLKIVSCSKLTLATCSQMCHELACEKNASKKFAVEIIS